MKLKNTLLTAFLVWGNVTAFSYAQDSAQVCDEFQYAKATEQVRLSFNSVKDAFQKQLASINCVGTYTGCDQIKMAAYTKDYQVQVQNIATNYTSSNLDVLCYEIKSSTAKNILAAEQTSIKNAAIAVNQSKTQGIASPSSTGTASEWISLGIPYAAGCESTQAAISTCGRLQKTVSACRAEVVDQSDFFGGSFKSAEILCGPNISISSTCAEIYSRDQNICAFTDTQWTSVQSCFAADKTAERAANCPKGCFGKPNYHVCDWSASEWSTYGWCNTLEAKSVREKACPNGRAGVDEKGPVPVITMNGYSVIGAAGSYYVSPGNNVSFNFSSIKGNVGSYCVGLVGSTTCSNQANFTRVNSVNTSSGNLTLTHNELPPGQYQITLLNNTTGKTSSKIFTATTLDIVKGACPKGVWTVMTDLEFTPAQPAGSNPSSFYEGKACPCTRDAEVKDNSGTRWQCMASTSKDPNRNCTAKQGTFCSGDTLQTEWIEYVCEGAPENSTDVKVGKWSDQGNKYYHRFTGMKCGSALLAPIPATAPAVKPDANGCNVKTSSGQFCTAEGTYTEWVTSCTPPAGNWAPQPDFSYHRGTSRPCSNTTASPAIPECRQLNSGSFCGGDKTLVDWVTMSCSESPGPGWNAQGSNNWHKGSTKRCN